MASYDFAFYGRSSMDTPRSHAGRFFVEATVVAGQPLIRNASVTAGEVENPTTTAAVAMAGLATEAVTYSTTQADFDGFPNDEEGTVAIIADPFATYAFRVSGSATTGAALTTLNVLTNTSASAVGTTITATEVSTVDMDGGIIVGRTGNNAGVVRINTTHTNSTSNVVTQPFPRTIAVGDTFIRVPYSKACQTVQLTATNFLEADGSIAFGTGAEFTVVEVRPDIVNDEVVIVCIARSHMYNPLA